MTEKLFWSAKQEYHFWKSTSVEKSNFEVIRGKNFCKYKKRSDKIGANWFRFNRKNCVLPKIEVLNEGLANPFFKFARNQTDHLLALLKCELKKPRRRNEKTLLENR